VGWLAVQRGSHFPIRAEKAGKYVPGAKAAGMLFQFSTKKKKKKKRRPRIKIIILSKDGLELSCEDWSDEQMDSALDEEEDRAICKFLMLEYNRLTRVPMRAFEITHLVKLYLQENLITELPPAISHLVLLTDLDLSNNPIKRLPSELAKLTRLEE
jgi:hypothetical protein